MSDIDEFVDEYNDRVADILRAGHRSFSFRLNDWLDLLDNSFVAKPAIDSLESGFDFTEWYGVATQSVGGMVGSGSLNWSGDRLERLAQYLGLVRLLASDESAFADFSSKFLWAGKRLDDNIAKINVEIITPFVRDLLKQIKKHQQGASTAPASDRVVSLNHNSPDMIELNERLNEVETRMQNSNSLKLEDDYDRNLAEISAARRLIAATRVRLPVLQALLIPSLKWLGTKVAENTLQIAVTAVIVLLASILGFTIPGIATPTQ